MPSPEAAMGRNAVAGMLARGGGLYRVGNSLDEVNGVVEATLDGGPLLLTLGGVATEAEDVLDACSKKLEIRGKMGEGRAEKDTVWTGGGVHRSSWRP